ncbi:unnamed protein product, partial [marine sediment metagenome]
MKRNRPDSTTTTTLQGICIKSVAALLPLADIIAIQQTFQA